MNCIELNDGSLNNDQQQLSMDSQQVPVKVLVNIKTLWMTLRFNCKLSFAVKNEFSEVLASTDSVYPLVRGKAQVNDSIVFFLPLEAVTAQTQFKLAVIMSSANGIVPAGHVYFSIPSVTNNATSFTLPLERCEDSHSQLNFSISCQGSGSVISDFNFSKLDSARPVKIQELPKSMKLDFKDRAEYEAKLQCLKIEKYLIWSSSKKQQISEIAQVDDGSHISNEQLLKEHQDYWLEIVKLEGVVDTLKGEINNLKEENHQLRQQNQNIHFEEEKMHALISEVKQSNTIIEELQFAKNEHKTKLLQKQQAFQNIQKILEKQKEDHIQTKRQYEEILNEERQKVVNLTIKQEELSAKHEQLTELLFKSKAELQNEKNDKQELQSQLFVLNDLVTKKNQQLQNIQNQLELLKEQVNFMRENSKDELVKELSAKLNSSQKLFQESQQSTQKSQRQIGQLKDSLHLLKEQLKQAHQLLVNEKKIAEQQIRKRKLNEQKAQQILEEQLHHYEKEKDSHLSKVQEMKSKEVILSEELKMATHNLQQEKTKIQKMRKELIFQCQQKIAGINSVYNENLQKKQQECDKLFTKLQQQQEEMAKQNKIQQNQKKEMAILTGKFEALEQQFQLLTQAFNKQHNENEQKDSHIIKLQAEIISLSARCEEIEKERDSSVLQLESRLNEEKYSSNYTTSITEMNLELARLEGQNSQLRKQIEQLTGSRSEKEIKLEKQLGDVKEFAQGRLKQIMLLRRQSSELKAQLDKKP